VVLNYVIRRLLYSIIVLIVGYPIAHSAWMSLHKYNLKRPNLFRFVGLDNYRDIIASPEYNGSMPGMEAIPTWIHASSPFAPWPGPPTPTHPETWPAWTSSARVGVTIARTPCP
jgi:ABC-type sugar transport system permease subunit